MFSLLPTPPCTLLGKQKPGLCNKCASSNKIISLIGSIQKMFLSEPLVHHFSQENVGRVLSHLSSELEIGRCVVDHSSHSSKVVFIMLLYKLVFSYSAHDTTSVI